MSVHFSAKPGGRPLVKVIDFGIAKATGSDPDGLTEFTLPGQVIGRRRDVLPRLFPRGPSFTWAR